MGKVRHPHNLKRNTKPLEVSHVIYLDVETYDKKRSDVLTEMVFRLAVVKDVQYDKDLQITKQRTEVAFTPQDVAQYVNDFASATNKSYLIAHNTSFDVGASFLLHELDKLGWKISVLRAEVGSFILKAERNHRSLYILDNLNFLRGTLEELGKLIGIHKLSVNYESVDNQTLLIYCKQDVAILQRSFESYLRFLKDHNLGSFGLTISSQAFNAFRHRFMPIPIHIHTDPLVRELERHAYGGGYVMLFYIGLFKGMLFYKVDINSLYPFIMATMPMPRHFLRFLDYPSIERLETALKYYAVVADVTIKPKKPYFRRVTPKGVIYPLYTFRTVLTTPALIEALKQNAIVEVHSIAIYSKDVLFEQFVNELYAMRKQFKAEGNQIYNMLTKLMMNSLYGKFGARDTEWKERPDLTATCEILPIHAELTRTQNRAVYFINGKAYTFEDVGDSENTFIAIAAHITEYARFYLFSLIEKAGEGNVFYTDTDSLIVNEEGLNNLKDYLSETELGKLKIEGVAKRLLLNGKKDYVFGKEPTLKGISKSAIQIDKDTFYDEHWPSILSMLNTKEIKPYMRRKIKKMLKRIIWYADVQGNKVVPFTTPPAYDPNPLQLTPLPYPEYRGRPPLTPPIPN